MRDILRKINYILDSEQKRALLAISLMNLVAAFFELFGVSMILPIVNAVVDPGVIETNGVYRRIAEIFSLSTPRRFVMFLSVSLIAVFILKNIYFMIRLSVQAGYDYKNRRIVATKLLRCYLYQDYLFHVSHNVADLQRNIGVDVTSFFQAVSSFISMSVELLTIILLFVFLLVVDYKTTILLGLILGAFLVIIYKVYKRMQVRAGERARDASAALNKWLLQAFGGIKEVKVLNREMFFYRHYDEAYIANNTANKQYNLLSAYPKYIIEAACVSTVLGLVCIRIAMGADLGAFITSLSAFAVASIRILPSFNRLSEYMGRILFSKKATDSIYNDLKFAEGLRQETLSEEAKCHPDQKMTFEKTLRISNLTFSYPGTTTLIFDNANVEIQKNSSVAFIGESGAGKTTLADIILGLLQPTGGQVTADGVDVFSDLDAWHKTIGYIPQSIYLMDDTIRENIVFGSPEGADPERIRRALQMAQLEQLIESLPDGLDTQVGERGVRLSGGQRQRLGIARALYNEPDVLILDEATSSLDNETETAVMESIDHLHGKTTLIIIAHRLTTIKNCDRIFEVGGRTIVEKSKQEVFADA